MTKKKNYYDDEIYRSIHSKMYVAISFPSESNRCIYKLCLLNCSLSSDDVNVVGKFDVFISLTYSAAFDFRNYTMSPDTLINLFASLCILSGKNIVKH